MSIQANEIASRVRREVQIEQTTQLVNKYDIDILSILESCVNQAHFLSSETLDSWFDAEVNLCSVVGFDRHKDTEVAYQSGGTGLVTINEISEYYNLSSNDFRGLKRWSWYTLEGSPSHRTRVILVYTVGKSKHNGLKTVYQQHLCYIQQFGIDTNPYNIF